MATSQFSAQVHSITLSARSRITSGILTPSALAVFMFASNSNFVGCSIGKSPGCGAFQDFVHVPGTAVVNIGTVGTVAGKAAGFDVFAIG